jgi:catechol 2,3-dioxygenase-like lactoylglutathione lyase family enzyme
VADPGAARSRPASPDARRSLGHRHLHGSRLLEPNANPIGKTFQEGLFKQGIPATAFEVEDIEQEFQRLKALGVAFTQGPSRHGPVTIAVCADTCGNLIQLYQKA